MADDLRSPAGRRPELRSAELQSEERPALRPEVQAVAAGKAMAGPDFEPAVGRLVEAYLAHTQLEEEVFLPLADAILARNPNHLAALDLSLHMRHAPMPRMAYV